MNKSYLSVDKSNDEMYTPFYAVEPLIKYLKQTNFKTIWCPFDEEWSAFVQRFIQEGYNVIHGSILSGKDFFVYEPDKYDIIISNPPFSKKDAVLKRVYSLGRPFALLLPVPTLQGGKRGKLFSEHGLQILAFNKRIGFHSPASLDKITGIPCFASAYFCNGFLPRDLIVEELSAFERPLIDKN